MSNDYRNNHYVPQWYQKRFIPEGQRERVLYRLDFKPGTFVDTCGNTHQKKAVHCLGPKKHFVATDLYTTKIRAVESTAIEQFFFGRIDERGRRSVEYFAEFTHPAVNSEAFHDLIHYLSAQKLRTPKGLDWLSSHVRIDDRNILLRRMIALRNLFCAIWTECIWQIADASQSETKFIVSDHPVTVYNRCCGPRCARCRGVNDPEITLNATHTIFPLSLEKVLILTNVTWVRNPYQSELETRPNPAMLRSAMFDFTAIQTDRHLNEQEVREINFIIKSRAYSCIAAAKEEWLYPERHVSKSDWTRYGNGYLLMPDPRGVDYSTMIMMGFNNGSSAAYDAYGRRPGQEGFSFDVPVDHEYDTLHRFQGEFATMFGPRRRGRAFNSAIRDPVQDSDENHRYHLNLAKTKYGRRKH